MKRMIFTWHLRAMMGCSMWKAVDGRKLDFWTVNLPKDKKGEAPQSTGPYGTSHWYADTDHCAKGYYDLLTPVVPKCSGSDMVIC